MKKRQGTISREELSDAVQSLFSGLNEDAGTAKRFGMGGALVVGAAGIAAAYAMGRRRGEREDETYIEIQRVT